MARINRREREFASLSDANLRECSLALKYRVRSGEPLVRLMPDAFALVREAANRTLGMRHFDVQLLGGWVLLDGGLAEMQTGEGKTLTATLPLFLRGLTGRGAWVATANDYLARRDAEWMKPIFELLGLSVGVIQASMSRAARREAYECDVTYGTANEFGFDLLRDRLLAENDAGDFTPVQRELHFALIDEADSLLIDAARIPLIISAPSEIDAARESAYRWSAELVKQLQPNEDFSREVETGSFALTAAGRMRVRHAQKPPEIAPLRLIELYEFVERAVQARQMLKRDWHYVVNDNGIVLVEESTGRLAHGRAWRRGMHQAVEAQEGLPITAETEAAASLTIQDLFLRFEHLAGMTGTAWSDRREFRQVYHLNCVRIPTHRRYRRVHWNEQVFASREEKWSAVANETAEQLARGRPVLIGTRSIERSEELSEHLTAAGIEHQILNARNEEAEAEIIARSGEAGQVTVSTNMAGRGTDIRLGDGVAEKGGLHVIATELHDSARIDRQLAGRAARQGDPGTVRQFLSIDDDVLERGFGAESAERIRRRAQGRSDLSGFVRLLRKAQRRIERRHARQRAALLRFESERRRAAQEMGRDRDLDAPM